jgi:chromosome segregation ATPase
MKNFQQNLLIVLALGLCGLCAYQWYNQTLQRREVQGLNQLTYEQATAIQGYTNSIRTMNQQIARMDAQITELRATVKSNDQVIVKLKVEINRLELEGESLTNQIAQYKRGVETLQAKLTSTYEDEKKLSDSIKEVVAQRDEFVQKYNDSVKDRNDVVNKYNDLVAKVEKLQSGGGKGSEK